MTKALQTLDKRLADFNRSWIGFDSLWNELKETTFYDKPNYPPYNIIKVDDTTDRIEIAVAGFDRDELEVQLHHDELVVKGKKTSTDDEKTPEYKYKGISARSFTVKWKLNPNAIIKSAQYVNGILSITVNVVDPPENVKRIEID